MSKQKSLLPPIGQDRYRAYQAVNDLDERITELVNEMIKENKELFERAGWNSKMNYIRTIAMSPLAPLEALKDIMKDELSISPEQHRAALMKKIARR